MIPEYYTWEYKGKTYTQITAPTKRAILAEYAKKYNLRTFVETGTCNGDCLVALHHEFDWCYSIELDRAQFEFTRNKLDGMDPYMNVALFQGDSGKLLPVILKALIPEDRILFWLDAHGEDWIGPIVEELEAIYASEAKGVILIDDMDYITDILPSDPKWREDPLTSRQYGIVRLVHETLES